MSKSWIVAGIAVVVIALYFVIQISVYNTAVGYEQTINQSASDIQVQKNRMHTVVLNLVQVVEQSSAYEGGVITDVTKLRSAAQSGDVTQINTQLKVLQENYPQLKAVENYTQLMTEISLSQNLISQQQKVYNQNVRDYKSFVKSQPAKSFLNNMGYEVQNFDYLTFDTSQTDLPTNLFGIGK